MPAMGPWQLVCWALTLALVACGGGSGAAQHAAGSGGAGAASSGGGGNGDPAYGIELSSGLGGAPGRCRINWCRDGVCHFTCLAVPDDQKSCDQAAAAYEDIPNQNYVDVEFTAGSTCQSWTGNDTLCVDEYGGAYYPYPDDECNPGDSVASAGGACFYDFCVDTICEHGCVSSDEAGCQSRGQALESNASVTSSTTRFSPGASCPTLTPSGSGGSAGQGSGGMPATVDSCGNCLTECADQPGCCSGEGCSCESACMPSGCSAPYQLCCNHMFCLCKELC